MSDLNEFSKTAPKLETVDAESIPSVVEPRSGSSKLKFGENTSRKKNIPKGLWTKCRKCAELIFDKDLDDNLKTCPTCGFHFPISARLRLASLIDEKSFKELDAGMTSVDILEFTGVDSYSSKLEKYKDKTGEADAVITGVCKMQHHKVAIGIMDFSFLGGSMGSVVGEKLTRMIELGTKNKIPVVIISTSGGARMYEGMFSLMQMAKTCGALAYHSEANLPYISVLTHPTTAGVMASYASVGDLILAEPGAMIGFAGPRVIKDTTQAELPPGFQTAEFLMDRGMIDAIVPRNKMRHSIINYLDYMSANVSKPKAKRAVKKKKS
ncbi:MAG: acetyl-CoA carboxylase, carboxyltransferase subunit beta [Opitutia bacterium TMED67]|nr:acetyl-CoA carboxylase carboxyl transferase subunit beta [Verrucomicrobiales bacterium]OUU68905.1 MAG: acetyl-CoA carboxylase, carboxyltransferase subunit beta [Opitutae bacterium TMED67]